MGTPADIVSFLSFQFTHGVLADMRDDPFSTTLSAWSQDRLLLSGRATHIGFVYEGHALLDCASGRFNLKSGMYFSVPGEGAVGGAGCGISICRWEYNGFFQIG